MQIVALEKPTNRGSLINVKSTEPQSRFIFRNNLVENNVFLGENTRLIEVDGPLMTISDNILRYNGYLSLD